MQLLESVGQHPHEGKGKTTLYQPLQRYLWASSLPLAYPSCRCSLLANKYLGNPMLLVSAESKVVWKIQGSSFQVFFVVRLFQQLLLVLGRKNSARVFAKRSEICRREAGTAPRPSPEVKGLSQSEVAVLSGYPAWDILLLCPQHTSSAVCSHLSALFLGTCLPQGCWGRGGQWLSDHGEGQTPASGFLTTASPSSARWLFAVLLQKISAFLVVKSCWTDKPQASAFNVYRSTSPFFFNCMRIFV